MLCTANGNALTPGTRDALLRLKDAITIKSMARHRRASTADEKTHVLLYV